MPDDPSALEAERRLLADRLAALSDAIAMLEESGPLKSDAAARLAMYRRNEQRIAQEIRVLEHALVRDEWLRTAEGGNGRSDLAADLLAQLGAEDAVREAGG